MFFFLLLFTQCLLSDDVVVNAMSNLQTPQSYLYFSLQNLVERHASMHRRGNGHLKCTTLCI